MKYLNAEQVLFIHARVVEETGGSHGIRDLGMLESAVERSQATFDNQELYPNAFLKASALLDSLINNLPFLDGNKRTGITSAALFLKANGWQLSASSVDLEEFTLQVAVVQPKIPSLAEWLRKHCHPIEEQ